MLAGGALGAFLVALGPIADGDIYWHLAAGNEILRGRALLRADPFTLSAAGRAWVDVHWLFQVAVAALHGRVGLVGLAYVKAAVVAIGAAIAVRTAERGGGAVARDACALSLVGLLFLARHLLPLRPVIVSLLFIALFLRALEAHRTGARRALWALPLLQIAWVNCQGLSPLGPALIGAYMIGAAIDARRWPPALLLARSSQASVTGTPHPTLSPPSGERAEEDGASAAPFDEGRLFAGRSNEGTEVATPGSLAPRSGERAKGEGSDASKWVSLRPLALALGLTALASFATPYGLDAVMLPARLLARLAPGNDNVFGRAIAENVPPFVLERTSPAAIAHFKWVLAALAAAFALVRPRVHVAHALVLLGFAGLALMANRNVLLFYWVTAPLAALALAPGAAARLRARGIAKWLGARTRGRLALAVVVGALGGELAVAAVALAREAPIGAPTPFHFPVESARWLSKAGARGPVFAPDQHGGYLTFTVPGLRPYIDTRLVLHTAAEYLDYLALFDDPARFDALDAAQSFRYVVLTTAYPDRYLGLVAHLAAHPAWRLVYTDGSEVLFARGGAGAGGGAAMDLGAPATVAAIDATLVARFGAQPAVLATARLHLARTLIAVGQTDAAERVLATQDSRAAAQLRARGRFAAGAFDAAEGLTRILLLQDARDTRSLTLMAELALARGRADEARRWLDQALHVDPYDPEARSVLARFAPAPAP